MPDDDAASAAVEPEPAEPEPVPIAKPEPVDEWADFDAERAKRTIMNLREVEKQAKATAKEKKQLEERLAELENAALSEQEKQAKRLAELEATHAEWQAERQDLILRTQFLMLAPSLGVSDPELALAVLDRAALEYDDDGNPTNLAEITLSLLEAKPILRGVPTASAPTPRIDTGAGRQAAPAPSLTAEELEAANELGMTPERYAAMKTVRTVADYQKLRQAETATAEAPAA